MCTALHRICCLALTLLLAAPSIAAACPIPYRTVGPLSVHRIDVRRPVARVVPRSAWALDASWTSTSPELNQHVVATGGRVYLTASFARQRSLGIDAAAPDGNGWVYGSDDDPDTPPCRLAGRAKWQPPIILVRENRRTVRIAAASQRTPGDPDGCVLGAGQAAEDWGCPTLTRSILRLQRPIGRRQLVFETFA
jgi:hypothetical protein